MDRGAFLIDAHDREVIAWRAVANSGISGADVQDMMLEAVEGLLGTHPLRSSSRSSATTARLHRAEDPHLRPPARPQALLHAPAQPGTSNGISEAFVHTLKRDYVQIAPLPDAASALALIGARFNDYNDHHPHSGLKIRSRREFITAQAAAACMSGHVRVGSRPMRRPA